MKTTYGKLFEEDELQDIRSKFFYVDKDFREKKRIFFDNAGGSFRLIEAEQKFYDVDAIPDCSEHSNELSHYLEGIEQKGLDDIKQVIFNAKKGTIYPSYTASQIMMEMVRVLSENSIGSNNVTTLLEHPSAYDSMTYYSEKYNRELRIAGVNKNTGGVDADEVISLIDENTAILCCMAASNISGYIYDIEKIFTKAREINPNIFIICDAVQHAPHGILDPEKYDIDVMNIAPYKFFGIRGFSVAYLSDRVAAFDHHRLLGKDQTDWSIGSPAAAHYASITAIVDYVVELGSKIADGNKSRRDLFEIGMTRIEDHERALLEIMLEGNNNVKGLRHCDHLKVQMDGKDLNTRDFILGVEFDNINCEQAITELEKRGVIAYERSSTSMYSKRMVEAFDFKGVVRISPLHVNSVEEVEKFLKVVQEVANL
ncbi:aminotransferase class V-fold PLP-dependent enzyme [Enterococcus hulanensis]|uniref:aminotransferase class V-fold PLP-dependent enzyme n=1 Tax=Enterococcus hulanensis TaxID=2559929 RepID=UPI001A8F6EAE|nr:aminotransferase class V-fold PLP-dependent enzyme [Enterococcus hulanensis]MBO0458242.1 aminotransferase class V-fold PLP-dependent enzyme [Enterococcus hulanensis]